MESLKAIGETESTNDSTLSNSFTRVSGIIAQLEMFEHELVSASIFFKQNHFYNCFFF